jgi:hypothetical protein
VEKATKRPEESKGVTSRLETVEEATLTLVITLPATLDTFAFAEVAPSNFSKSILSPT